MKFMAINQKPNIHELVICANIFVRKDGKYLMLKRSPKKKFAPGVVHPYGGKINNNENAFVGAQRELLEEAGIKVKNMRLEAVLLEITPTREMFNNWLIFHFSADYELGEIKETEEGEAVMLSEEEILKQNLFPSVKKIIKNILNPNDGTIFASFKFDENGEIVEIESSINNCVV
jgi:8-oxo-dGTP pyrophosphatase MutT (NUDIX family)